MREHYEAELKQRAAEVAAAHGERDQARVALAVVRSERDEALADRDHAIDALTKEQVKTQKWREAARLARQRVSDAENAATATALQFAGKALYRTMRVLQPRIDAQRWPLYQALAAGDLQYLERATRAPRRVRLRRARNPRQRLVRPVSTTGAGGSV